MICPKCNYESGVLVNTPDGQDMFVCDMEGDSRLPFDMEEDTEVCSCFEPMEEEE